VDVVVYSKPAGTTVELPIIALRSPRSGDAMWILSGIHSEEPAGPNAIAEAIDDIAALGERLPVVLVPLCNPHGYARNWRYLNTPIWSEEIVNGIIGPVIDSSIDELISARTVLIHGHARPGPAGAGLPDTGQGHPARTTHRRPPCPPPTSHHSSIMVY
jgi:hypothetical protein